MILLLFSIFAFATESVTVIDGIDVYGDRESLEHVGSAQKLDTKSMEIQKSTDAMKSAKQIPGVQIQEEDAFGLRPNIGLRGTHPHRSRKVVLMEDGVLIGPAPYSAPAAYYSPSMLHTENLEISKGFSAIPFGPNSIGGAINYITKNPNSNLWKAEVAGGSYGSNLLRSETHWARNRGAMLLSGSRIATDGFKQLPGGENTGFTRQDVLLKGRAKALGPEGEFQFKAGYSDEKSFETYLGLSPSDFSANPLQRYAASQKDEMKWNHQRFQLDYQRSLGSGLFKSSIYHHQFRRNWTRFNGFREDRLEVNKILRNPASEREILFSKILKGENTSSLGSEGQFSIVQNNRKYFSQGWQSELWQEWQVGSAVHSITARARLHRDQISRNHLQDYYSQENKKLVRETAESIRTNRTTDQAVSKSLSVNDKISWGNWKTELASRYEYVDYSLANELLWKKSKKSAHAFAPGAGLAWKFHPDWNAGVAISRGITLVGANAADKEGPERSISLEQSTRFMSSSMDLQAELTNFITFYQNIKGTASFSSGATNDQLEEEFSGGKAKIFGLEARVARQWSYKRWLFPVKATLTALDARFSGEVDSKNPEWGVGRIYRGDPLPYVPQWQGTLSLGSGYRKWRQEVLIQYTGKVFDQAVYQDRGEIPAYGILDWNTRWEFVKRSTAYLKIDNILNKNYAVSWRPFGLRPGKVRTFMLGFEQTF